MKVIYKYELDFLNKQTIDIPSNEILSVELQNRSIVVYALVDTDIEPIKYEFQIKGTGNKITFEVALFKFLGTVQIQENNLMFHIFYRKVVGK